MIGAHFPATHGEFLPFPFVKCRMLQAESKRLEGSSRQICFFWTGLRQLLTLPGVAVCLCIDGIIPPITVIPAVLAATPNG
jgi:hypothetical protein